MTDIVNPIDPPVVPPVPQRNDEATFEDRSDAGWEFAFNTLPGYMQDTMDNVHQNAVATNERALAADQRATDAETAKTAAETAREKAQEWAEGAEPAPGSKSAKGWAEEGESAANSAWAAAAAAGSSAGLPQPLVPGKVLGATSTDTVGWVDSFKVGDLKYSLQPPGDGWLEVNKTYLQSAYPGLYGVLGIQPSAPVGRKWTTNAITNNSTYYNTAGWAFSNGVVLFTGRSSDWSLIYKSTDWGQTFTENPGPSGHAGVPANSMIGYDDGVTLAIASGLRRSTDYGDNWTTVPLPTDPGTPVRVLKLSDDSSLVFTTTGVYRSSDQGVTWAKIYTTVLPGISAAAESAPGVIVVSSSGTDGGISRPMYASFDYGYTWQMIPKPSPTFYTTWFASDGEGAIYATSADGTDQQNTKLFKCSAAGQPWELVFQVPEGSLSYALCSLGSVVVLNQLASGVKVWMTRNQAASWGLVPNVTLPSRIDPVFVPVPGGVIVAGGMVARKSLQEFAYDTDTMFYVPGGPIDDTGNFNTLIKAG